MYAKIVPLFLCSIEIESDTVATKIRVLFDALGQK